MSHLDAGADADLEALLERTSRTFALAIPLLPEPMRREVALAYLLFRIADTFEDAARWPREDRLAALREFGELLTRPVAPGRAEALAARWVAARPCDHEGYLELLAAVPRVLAELAAVRPAIRAALVPHTMRTIEGMAGFVARGDAQGNLALGDLGDLRHYCYIVAGIVGELLTEIFLASEPSLEPSAAALRSRARAFGEGLQLVNILKDSTDDAREGRVYLPQGATRAEVIAMARDDLRAGGEYTRALQQGGASRGVIAFCAFPVLLARASLDVLESAGAGAKVGRAEVAAMMVALDHALDAGEPCV